MWLRFGLAFIAALLALGCFQSGNMVAAAYDLPEGKVAQWVVERAENWHGWMELTGVAGWSEHLAEKSTAIHERLVEQEEF
ncbi:hypothetical protein ACFQ14_01095 [Pseudahrensia aquimaris]|uniref:Uncharacterized protein n=1 Tax=Pseudahrensia aquimaris TaxID=744461 RepID=A0ABW3FF17_9HYPH